MNNLGVVLTDQGKYDEAKLMYEKLLIIFKKNYGENHPETARTLENLANVFYS